MMLQGQLHFTLVLYFDVALMFCRSNPPGKRKRGRPRKENKTKSTLPVINCKPNISSTMAVSKIKKKDSKIKKVQPVAFASENAVIPISELFRDIPGSKLTNATPEYGIFVIWAKAVLEIRSMAALGKRWSVTLPIKFCCPLFLGKGPRTIFRALWN